MESVWDILSAHCEKHGPSHDAADIEKRTAEEFRRTYNGIRQSGMDDTHQAEIPRFHYVDGLPLSGLEKKVRTEAQKRYLKARVAVLYDNDELGELWNRLFPPNVREKRIMYDSFFKIESQTNTKAPQFFKASVFSKFAQDRLSAISSLSFFHYVVRKVKLKDLTVSLCSYDEDATGYLTEQQMEYYIYGQIKCLAPVPEFTPAMYPFYFVTAVRKFFFFLDPNKRGRISIKKLLSSSIIHEFNYLLDPLAGSEEQSDNWFSPRSVISLYSIFSDLDKDHDHRLSKAEMMCFNKGTMTEVFIDRLFQEFFTHSGKMGYKEFLDFILAIEYKRMPQAQQYFWRILDMDKKGYLTPEDVNYFVRDVMRRFSPQMLSIKVEDITNELFDMIHPVDRSRITLKDVLDSGCGHTFVSILTDVNGFLSYENRESEKGPQEGE